jgi:WD40 repeat protein/tRNA A-37 threonylcarbamoyl transferase component Bud32
MCAEQKKDEEAIYYEAISKRAKERKAYIEAACGDDAELAARVEALLKAREVEDSFLEGAVLGTDVTWDETPLSEGPGTVVGRYKLLEKIGEGGMAVVYMAEQDKPLRRRVALKIIKLGMDTKQVIARFEAERQALAMMDHPNIAKVFDAGATETGRPYFVMELVRGVSIAEYCDTNKLNTQQRLDLFISVCNAVHHAHQKGIIHRDIKPSNIMVTLHDGEPVPKIIDFGIAKATNQRFTEQTVFTRYAEMIGTPEYMSPEQAEMSGLDVDTRTDIYSLGVVLYELLTGVLPFDPGALRSAGLGEIRRIIREEEPPRPSTRLSTLGEEAKKIAESRRTDIATLARRLHSELEWIPLKAMRKDRTRRYRSASELADDIQNYLDGNPLLAGPESAMYRVKKFVWRHAGVVATVLLMAAVITLGFAVSTTMYFRAEHARQKETIARAQAQQAQANEAQLRRQAEAKELTMRQLAYASDMSLAQQALAMNDLGRARRLLEDHRPAPGELDLRGWEWRYLWQECRSDSISELCRYPNSAYSVAYSPDGKVLAVAGLIQNFVEIWDVPGRKRIATLQPKQGQVVTFSPHGDLLATDAGKQIQLWQTGTWNPVGQLALAGNVQVVKFSPDGRRLASLSYPDELTVWEVDQRTVVRQIRGLRPEGAHIGALDFSPDGRALVIGDADHRLQAVDLASGNTDVNIPEAHSEGITAVAWSPNGSIIASGSGYTGGPIRLWDAISGKPLGTLEGHTEWICELIFSTDGLRLYSASADQTIRIWDVEQRRCLATLRGCSDEVYGLALSPDGTMLASASKDGVVAFWNAVPRPEEELPRPIELGQFGRPAFAPDSRVLAMSRAGTVSLFDLVALREIEQVPDLGTDVSMVAYSPDGTLLASGSRSGKIRVWSCAERRLLRELEGHKEQVDLLRFRADGRRLLSVNPQGKVIWWDTLTWQAVGTFVVEPFGGWAVSPDGRLLAVGAGVDVRWLDAETGELLATSTGGHRHWVAGIAFSSDGSRVSSVAQDGTVAIWDPSSFQLIAAFKGHMKGAHGVAFSPDGGRLATGGGGRQAVKLWDLSTYRELMTLPGQGSLFWFVAFSPDGSWLAACSRDEGRLHLWRAPSFAEIEAVEKGSRTDR